MVSSSSSRQSLSPVYPWGQFERILSANLLPPLFVPVYMIGDTDELGEEKMALRRENE